MVKIKKSSIQTGDPPFSIGLDTGFRFVSTLKAGCFCDLSVGIPLRFPIFEHVQRLGLLARPVEILSFDLYICHSVSHFALLLLPHLLFFAGTHLDRLGAAYCCCFLPLAVPSLIPSAIQSCCCVILIIMSSKCGLFLLCARQNISPSAP